MVKYSILRRWSKLVSNGNEFYGKHLTVIVLNLPPVK